MPTPMPSMVFSPWSVVLVPFPVSAGEEEAEQNRPAVVVSAARLGEEHGLYWIAMITTPAMPPRDGQIAIADLSRAGLPRPAVVVPSKLMTVSVTMVRRRIGSLSRRDAAAVERVLRGYLPAGQEPSPISPGAEFDGDSVAAERKDFAPE